MPDLTLETTRTRKRYDRSARIYDAMYWPGERFMLRRLRRRLWSRVPAGELLEVGVGTGENFSHHPAGARVTGVDLSPRMLEHARRRTAESAAQLELLAADVQEMPFDDDAFEAAVATFVFCSVPDPARGLTEIARVVRPGGAIFLLEHVRVDLPLIGPLMDIADPLAVRISGAHVNRRTIVTVRDAEIGAVTETRHGPFGIVRMIEIGVA